MFSKATIIPTTFFSGSPFSVDDQLRAEFGVSENPDSDIIWEVERCKPQRRQKAFTTMSEKHTSTAQELRKSDLGKLVTKTRLSGSSVVVYVHDTDDIPKIISKSPFTKVAEHALNLLGFGEVFNGFLTNNS